MPVINVIKAIMYCIPKDMIVLVCPPSNMPFKQDNTLRQPRRKISILTAANWIKWAFHLIGVEKFGPPPRIIINGPNGFLFNCLSLGMTNQPTKQCQLQTLFLFFQKMAIATSMRFAMRIHHVFPQHNGQSSQKKNSKRYCSNTD